MTRCRSVSIRSVTWFRWWKASSIQRETLLPDETNEVSDSSTQPPRLSACTFVKPGHLSPLSLLLLPSSKQCKCHRSPDVLPQVQNVWKDVGTFLVNVPSKTFISLKDPACWSLFYQASPVSLGSRISVVSKCAGQKKKYRHYIGAHIVILWNIFLSSQVPMQRNQNPYLGGSITQLGWIQNSIYKTLRKEGNIHSLVASSQPHLVDTCPECWWSESKESTKKDTLEWRFVGAGQRYKRQENYSFRLRYCCSGKIHLKIVLHSHRTVY